MALRDMQRAAKRFGLKVFKLDDSTFVFKLEGRHCWYHRNCFLPYGDDVLRDIRDTLKKNE